MSVTKVSEEKWKTAQAHELAVWGGQPYEDGDDWNQWWEDAFHGYMGLGGGIRFALEVGCGPYAQNIRRIERAAGPFIFRAIEDPLLNDYIRQGKKVKDLALHHGYGRSSDPIETMDFGFGFDLLICINVMSHVRDVQGCFNNMLRHIKTGGRLVFGNEITSAADMANCPEMASDPMHPIKIDMEDMAPLLDQFEDILVEKLPRIEGRNPYAHYGTLIYIGRKR